MRSKTESCQVSIRMLGGFQVEVAGQTGPQKFRSHTAERLLALLALKLGRESSKGDFLDLLWPDSDGDRQSQNLRRALTDIRQVFYRHLSLLGSFMGSKAELLDAMHFVERGAIRAVIDRTLPLADARRAHELMQNRAQFGKLVLKP